MSSQIFRAICSTQPMGEEARSRLFSLPLAGLNVLWHTVEQFVQGHGGQISWQQALDVVEKVLLLIPFPAPWPEVIAAVLVELNKLLQPPPAPAN